MHGHGVVVDIEENLDFPVRVDAKNESDIGYTYDGRYYGNSTPTLSFTEYTLQGFSQERQIALPEVGELCLMSTSIEPTNNWDLVQFGKYVNSEITYRFESINGSYYSQMKRIKILD